MATPSNLNIPQDNSPLGGLEQGSYTYSNFIYPLNLGVEGAGLDHYILFYINETTTTQFPAKFVGAKRPAALPQMQQNAINDSNASGNNKTVDSNGVIKDSQDTTNSGAAGLTGNVSGSSLKQPIRRVSTVIALYMPPDYTTKYSAKWGDTNLGPLGAGGNKNFLDSLKAFGGNIMGTIAANAGSTLGTQTDLNVADAAGLATRMATNPHAEVIFQNIDFRTFAFSFKFMPQSEDEADNAFNIVQAFKFYAAPEVIVGAGSRFFIYPGEFDIKFIANGAENAALPKISTCALTNIDVTYSAAGQWAAFRANPEKKLAHPLFIHLNLTFKELEIMSKSRILQGY